MVKLNKDGHKNPHSFKVDPNGIISKFTAFSMGKDDLFKCSVKTFIGDECHKFDFVTTGDWIQSNTYESVEYASELWKAEYRKRINELDNKISKLNKAIEAYKNNYNQN